MNDGAEPVVRQAVEAFMARDLDGILRFGPLYYGHDGVRDWFDNVFGVFPDWRPRPRAATQYWLGARVRAAKIVFLGFFRTEDDALEAVT